MKKTNLLISTLLFYSFFSVAEPSKEERQAMANELLHKGEESYKLKKHEEAANFYISSMQQWVSVEAMSNLCNLYLYGQGVPQNFTKAKSLCEKAAQYNDLNALVMLGEIYLNGKGVSVNEPLGISYYRKAADLGHIHAQYVLGMLLLKSNPTEAKNHLKKAADSGHPQAQVQLSKP
jgi:TPR repeat protein